MVTYPNLILYTCKIVLSITLVNYDINDKSRSSTEFIGDGLIRMDVGKSLLTTGMIPLSLSR